MFTTLNPFWHGTPVPPEQFKGRDQELCQVISRIRTGQSTAITGSPRGGKTSLLNNLAAPIKRHEIYEKDADSLVLSYLDAYNWGTEFGAVRFWETAFRPLLESTETTCLVPTRPRGNAVGKALRERNAGASAPHSHAGAWERDN